jgi:hypothetical protein
VARITLASHQRLDASSGDGMQAGNYLGMLRTDDQGRLVFAYYEDGSSNGDFPAIVRYDADDAMWRPLGPPVPMLPSSWMAVDLGGHGTELAMSGDRPSLGMSVITENDEWLLLTLELTSAATWQWLPQHEIESSPVSWVSDWPRFRADRSGAPMYTWLKRGEPTPATGPLTVARFDGTGWMRSQPSTAANAEGYELVDMSFEQQGAAVVAYIEDRAGSLDVVVKRSIQPDCPSL